MSAPADNHASPAEQTGHSHREPILRADLDEAHQTDGPSWDLVLPVNKAIADEVAQLREDLFDRYIGRTPELLVDLLGVIEAAYLTGFAQDQIPVELVDDAGTSVTISGRSEAGHVEESPEQLSPEDEEAFLGTLAEMEAHEQSPEGQAEIARQERFFQLMGEREDETKKLFAAWADEHAAEYQSARDAWWNARHAKLREEVGDAQWPRATR